LPGAIVKKILSREHTLACEENCFGHSSREYLRVLDLPQDYFSTARTKIPDFMFLLCYILVDFKLYGDAGGSLHFPLGIIYESKFLECVGVCTCNSFFRWV
jgi:hypothetical protein